MTQTKARCLILACGNTLRSDDGIGPWLAAWAWEHLQLAGLRIISRQQWTPDLAEDISAVEFALFIDCSVATVPGSVHIDEVGPAVSGRSLETHHLGAAELLELSRALYTSLPRISLLMTVGAGSVELGEEFSEPIERAIPLATATLEQIVRSWLEAA